jgi:hypothetical protein
MCGPRPDLEYHYAGGGSGRIAKHLAKIAIQGDKRSAFARRTLQTASRPQPRADLD